MRRVICFITILGFVLAGCVQADTTYIEGEGYVQVTPGGLLQAQETPGQETLPTPDTLTETLRPTLRPRATITPNKTPSAIAPTPGSAPVATPTKPEAPVSEQPLTEEPLGEESLREESLGEESLREESLREEPPHAQRLYLRQQPAFDAGISYTFQGGQYTEQDLHMLCMLLNLRQWSGLQSVFGLYDTILTPDIRMIDFARDGIFAPVYEVDTLQKDESMGIAWFTLLHADMEEDAAVTFFLFTMEEQAYAPLSVIRVDLRGRTYSGLDYEFEQMGDSIFLVTWAQETGPQEEMMRERWYDCKDGMLKLDFVLTGERRGSDGLTELYSTVIEVEEVVHTNTGFALRVMAEVVHQFEGMEGSPTPISLMTGQEFALYYDAKRAEFYAHVDRQSFFADTGRIEDGQYKYLFDEQLTQIVTLARHPQEVEWAQALLNAQDWVMPGAQQPAEEKRHSLTIASAVEQMPLRIVGNNKRFNLQTLEKLQGDILAQKGDDLMQLLAAYGIILEAEETAEPFELQWQKISGIACTLDVHAAKERIAILDLRYTIDRKNCWLVLLFKLDSEAWIAQELIAFSPRYDNSEAVFQYADGNLYATYTQGTRNGAPVYETIVIGETLQPIRFVSAYTDRDGKQYTVQFAPAGASYHEACIGSFTVKAVLENEEAPVLAYTQYIWNAPESGYYLDDASAELLLSGEIGRHTGVMALIEDVIAKRAALLKKEQETPEEEEKETERDEGQRKEGEPETRTAAY